MATPPTDTPGTHPGTPGGPPVDPRGPAQVETFRPFEDTERPFRIAFFSATATEMNAFQQGNEDSGAPWSMGRDQGPRGPGATVKGW